MSEEIKQKIDSLSYEDMLRIIRFTRAGHYWCTGETGDYFFERYTKLKSAMPEEEKVRISKAVGWDK